MIVPPLGGDGHPLRSAHTSLLPAHGAQLISRHQQAGIACNGDVALAGAHGHARDVTAKSATPRTTRRSELRLITAPLVAAPPRLADVARKWVWLNFPATSTAQSGANATALAVSLLHGVQKPSAIGDWRFCPEYG